MKTLFLLTVIAFLTSVSSFAQDQMGRDSHWEKQNEHAATPADDRASPLAQDEDCTTHKRYGGVPAEDALLSGQKVEFKEFKYLGDQERMKSAKFESSNGTLEIKAGENSLIEVQLSKAALEKLAQEGITADQVRTTEVMVIPNGTLVYIRLSFSNNHVSEALEFLK